MTLRSHACAGRRCRRAGAAPSRRSTSSRSTTPRRSSRARASAGVAGAAAGQRERHPLRQGSPSRCSPPAASWREPALRAGRPAPRPRRGRATCCATASRERRELGVGSVMVDASHLDYERQRRERRPRVAAAAHERRPLGRGRARRDRRQGRRPCARRAHRPATRRAAFVAATGVDGARRGGRLVARHDATRPRCLDLDLIAPARGCACRSRSCCTARRVLPTTRCRTRSSRHPQGQHRHRAQHRADAQVRRALAADDALTDPRRYLAPAREAIADTVAATLRGDPRRLRLRAPAPAGAFPGVDGLERRARQAAGAETVQRPCGGRPRPGRSRTPRRRSRGTGSAVVSASSVSGKASVPNSTRSGNALDQPRGTAAAAGRARPSGPPMSTFQFGSRRQQRARPRSRSSA